MSCSFSFFFGEKKWRFSETKWSFSYKTGNMEDVKCFEDKDDIQESFF